MTFLFQDLKDASKPHFSSTLNWLVVSKILLFSALSGEDEPILTHIFQLGWLKPPTREFPS